MRKILSLALALVFSFALFGIFDVGKAAAAEPFQKQTIAAAESPCPIILTKVASFRPARQMIVNFSPPNEPLAQNGKLKIYRPQKKYGFRFSHKNFYPPENRMDS